MVQTGRVRGYGWLSLRLSREGDGMGGMACAFLAPTAGDIGGFLW